MDQQGQRSSDASRTSWLRRARIAGLIVIVPIAWRGAVDPATGDTPLVYFLGVLLMATVAWLTISGSFGMGDARREDWVGLIPFAVALIVREVFTLHSVQEIEIQFATGPIGRHSVVSPLLQSFFLPIVADPQRFTMHMNGVLGALACLGLYLFVRQRTRSREAGFLCALFLATHPLVARFSPTDGPYALLLASWFAGLALLSAARPDGWALLGGATLVGIASTARMEGSLFLLASLLLLNKTTLIAAARRHRASAVGAFLILYGLVVVHMWLLLPGYMVALRKDPSIVPIPLEWLAYLMTTDTPYANPLLARLIAAGAIFGILPRLHLGLAAYLAMVIVLLPVAGSWRYGSALHKMMPTYALQTIVAGMGAYIPAAWLPFQSRWRWLAIAPGAAAAFAVLVMDRAELTKPYLFTDEYALVRNHLAPGGVSLSACTLLTLNMDFVGDLDIHDFGQVVPGVRVLDCRRHDCLGALARGGCFYYIRSAACYYHVDGVPPECAMTGMLPDGDPLPCLNETSRRFEQSLDLETIETRTIDIYHSFQDRRRYAPLTAAVTLYRVRTRQPIAPAAAENPEHAAAAPFQPVPEKGVLNLPGTLVELADRPSIPSGQDPLILTMLGGSDVVASDCKLDAAVSDHGVVDASYRCPAGEVTIRLSHPSTTTTASLRTEQFALTPVRGTPPTELMATLVSLIRAREAEFRWGMLPPPRPNPAIVPLAISGVVGLLVVGLAIRRPRRQAQAE